VVLIACLSVACASTLASPTPDAPRDFQVSSAGVSLPVHTMGGGANAQTLIALHGGPGIAADTSGAEALQRVTLADCGHFPFWEQPEQFLSELRAFVSTVRSE
jgi:hypothetical protein